MIIFNLVGTLPPQVNVIGSMIFYRIAAWSQSVLIIDRSHRRSPVYDQGICTVFGDSHSSHIIGLLPGDLGIFKIDPPEIRFFSCPLISQKLPLALP